MVAKMTVDAMMMMKSVATSRQPKSALIAAITPRTQSRITKPHEPKHRVSALVAQGGALAHVLVDERDQRRVAPGQRRDRELRLAVGVELLREHAARERGARHPVQDVLGRRQLGQ